MAEFLPVFEKMIRLEGGFVLHDVPGDRGGQTYAGISSRAHPDWPGWKKIDAGEMDAELTGMVREFYRQHYWEAISGDAINSGPAAWQVFDFGVNAGIRTSVKIAQLVIGATPDGVFGPKTLAAMNEAIKDDRDDELFVLRFSMLRVLRYKNICLNDSRRGGDNVVSNLKFLPGWINRVEKGITS
jgi:lysozyme family protein